MAQGEGAVWVIGDAADRRLWRIDPERHRIEATIDLGFPPGGVAAGSGAVWVTDELGDRVVRIDPATNRVVGVIPVGRGAIGVATGAGSVWVADAIDHAVTRIDPLTNRVTATIPVKAAVKASRSAKAPSGRWAMRARAGLALLAAAALWLAAGCGGSKPEAFRIGILVDCYGPFSAIYQANVASAELPLLERGGETASASSPRAASTVPRSRGGRSSSRSAASPETKT